MHPRAMRAIVVVVALPAAGLLAVGAGSAGRTAAGGGFDTAAAYALTARLIAYGPRPAGSAVERRVARALVRLVPGGHFEAVPGGLRNVVGSLRGRAPAIVVGAHYDSTPVPGYLGANNSAAGVAAVIEIARALARDPARAGDRAVRFALFDGEEAPTGFTDFYGQGDRGSKAYVAAHRTDTAELVLLDFIANRGLRIPREAGSDPALWARLRAAASAVGAGRAFPAATVGQVLDDHTPFRLAGIPSIDLIDFDYPCWQRTCDTLSQISRTSLGLSGRTVLALVRAERRG
ncbi:MAG: M28 family metallopeptidase [Actinobacteria bacterium]|nr:M28 family metallopeptidase [Actinomycetota bacterium]